MRDCYRRVIVVLALLGALWPISGLAQPASGARVALVIGNDRYLHQPVLDNPVRDAQAVAATLTGLGFRVRAAENLGREAMIEALLAFADAARGAEVAVIYFAGHGVQLDSGGMAENHLIPVDARLADARRVPDETLPLSRVLREVDGVRALVVLLDACRNNPVAQRMAGLGTRMAARSGLAPVPEAMSQGALIAFAAAPGQVALDGERGTNGPFARALARHLAEPVEVGLALQRTAAAVRDATGGRQRPEVLNRLTLTEHLFLAAQPRPVPVPSLTPGPDPLTMETALWNAVRESARRDDLQAYLDRFPQGLYAPLARNRLAALADAAARTDTMLSPSPSPSPPPPPPRARSDEASLRAPAPAIVEPASPPRGSRFVVGPCGSIFDAQTRLEWFVGPDRNFSWTEASSWAAGLQDCGGQWAMPTRAQLATLFEAGKSAGQGYFTQGRHFPAQIDPVFAGIGGGSWVWASGSATGQGAPAFNFNQNIEVRMASNGGGLPVRAFAVRQARGR